ncbi:hypothetical protein [Halorubrum sp. Atlit-26R]|uniref:hypothetical protein n=1 Tax=Halorubrum sp. Atlit-26R TaxID=2282128 RepID=UPI000EF1FF59|nr:hypothetical protein [Halorubrum sp. Atlit-26R]RLM62554.1 hypothetical protein DVK07_18585 [Halorubrum sp. Atlit-26R]
MSSQAQPGSDGGRLPDTNSFELGDTVLDREDDDPNTATVINCPPVSCDAWDVGEETVADHNPAYDAEADVIVVAFDDDLAEAKPDYDGTDPIPLAEVDIPTYAFPPGRLVNVEASGRECDSHRANASPLEGFDGVRELKERLEETSDVGVHREDGEPVLTITKAGREYRIRSDGSVSDGPFQSKLADVAAEFLGGDD